jgi:hypothetical protein
LLSTKPKEPFELSYKLPAASGVYTLRVIAEDIAGHRSEDSLRIAVGDAELDPLPSSVSSGSDTGGQADLSPQIVYPDADGIVFQRNEVVEFSFRIPSLHDAGITQLRAVVVNTQTQEENLLLKLSDGEGLYRRTWKGKLPGEYAVVLKSESRDGISTEWGRRAIVVR